MNSCVHKTQLKNPMDRLNQTILISIEYLLKLLYRNTFHILIASKPRWKK